MPQTLIPVDRQARIQKLIEEKGVVKVTELNKLFNVTELTIRRDFDILEKKGVLERTHGGAILRHRVKVEPLYAEKNQKYRSQKERIGMAVSSLINDGDTLLINTGSTNTQVLRYLTGKSLRVITSNANALVEIENPEIEVILTGGLYRRQSNSLIGDLTHTILKNVCGSKTIIGVDGVSIRFGLTTPIQEEAAVARLMMEQTLGPVIVVADSSKMGVVSNFVTFSLDNVDILVTDDGIKPEFKKKLGKKGVEVIIAE
ncbi:MAG: DeoR/GlpR transcriptional regulator [Desulfobacteraceae bacterium]|nr:DeoR/GlpR transcriptional regulator [Desulfobacteraceae bacterium]